MDLQRSERHCYKCDCYRLAEGGAMCKDGRGRKRFVCAGCLAYVPARTIVSRFGPAVSALNLKRPATDILAGQPEAASA